MFDPRKMQEQVLCTAIERFADSDTAREIVFGRDGTESNADWPDAAMERLENSFEGETVKNIRMGCQCGYGMEEKLALVNELKAGARSMEEFAGSQKAHEAGLYCENGQLYLQFNFCPCPMLAEVKKLRSKAWCQCSAGYSKALFEKAFECAVDVELLKSIKAGDEICLMRIIPQERVF